MTRITCSSVRRAGAWCAVACALTSGCAQLPRHSDQSARQVFAVALETLDDRYIDPISPDRVMISGLAQMSLIDDRLSVARTADSVVLLLHGEVISERASPTAHNIEEWAGLGARIIDDARAASSTLAAYDRERLFEEIFHGFVDGLDRYSRYLPPDDARNSRASREGFGGIGVRVERVNGEFVIDTIFPDRPATHAGLREHDRITHVDGKPVEGLSLSDVVARLRGKVGDPVRLTLRRTGQTAPFERDIVRDYIVTSTVVAGRHGNIMEIRLTGFNTGTVGELRRAIVRTAREIGPDLAGVVLDLRGNPGGLLDQAIAVTDLFLTRGRIISTKGRHPESNQLFEASPGEVLPRVPIVVVVNGRSASAAEIVAVALRDSGRAAIVGSTTFGKGTVQTIIRLPNQGELNVTWARILAPSGQTLDHQGVVPAICTNLSRERLDALIAALGGKDAGPGLDLADLRMQAHMPHYSAQREKACEPTDEIGPRDLEAARRLLVNGRLYSAAIARLRPSIAER